jgi:hypothetical protein
VSDRPTAGRSSDRRASRSAVHPVTRTGVPGPAPVTLNARTSTAPRTSTTLVTRAPAPATCRDAAHPSPTPSGSISVRPGSSPTITLLSYDEEGAVAVEYARRV